MLELSTTVSSKKQCQYIANIFVKQKLAVCVSFWPISSVYRWKGKVCEECEWMLVFKGREKSGKKLEKKLRELHPYELPVIAVQKLKVDKNFEKWMKQ